MEKIEDKSLPLWRKVWDAAEDILAGSFFITGIVLIFYGVLMRYILNEPKAWVTEISTYTIVWGALLGISIALRNNHHIQVDILYERLSRKGRLAMDIFANSCGILFCLFFTYYGFTLVSARFGSGMVSLDVGIPMWIVYLILPISGAMFLLRFIDRLAQVIINKGDVKHDNPLV